MRSYMRMRGPLVGPASVLQALAAASFIETSRHARRRRTTVGHAGALVTGGKGTAAAKLGAAAREG